MRQTHPKLTLRLPHEVYESVRRAAKGMKKPLDQALVTIVAGAIPSLEKVPLSYRPELQAMEDLGDGALWKEATASALPAQERRLEILLQKNGRNSLSEDEQSELAVLRSAGDRRMLRRSYAYLLLKYRGHRIPRLADVQL
jgi:hypothetical protein